MTPTSTLLGLLTAGVLLAGCGGGDAGSASGPTSSTTSPTTSSTPEPTADCLLTVPQVSRTLGGTWTREVRASGSCVYSSDRGAQFVATPVDQAAGAALRDARKACVSGIRPISTDGGGFVCAEQRSGRIFVVGNVVVDRTPWVVVIAPTGGGVPSAELKAMVAVMDAAA